MNRRNWFVSGLLLVLLVLALAAPVGGAAQAQTSLSRVRFLHAVPGSPPVDVYVDGALAYEGLAFGDVSPHFNVEGGDHAVEVKPSGRGAAAPTLLSVPVPLVPNLAFTVIVQGTPDALEASLYEDILDEIGAGFARLTAINAIADAPPLDIVTTEGGPLLQGVNYGMQFGTVNIGTGVQNLVMVPAGGAVESAIATIGEVPLRSGMLYTFVALGALDGAEAPAALVLETPVNGAAGSVLVQVAHGSPDAPAVDVYVGDTLIVPALAQGELTGHIALPAGDTSVALRPAGAPAADEPVLEGTVSLAADVPAVTLVATGELADGTLSLSVFEDSVAGLDSTQARVSVINAVPGAEVSANLTGDIVLASAVAAGEQGAATDLAPGRYMVLASVQGVETPVDVVTPEDTFIGGMYYTVLVFGGGANNTAFDARVSMTPVNVGLDSVPVSEGVAVAVAPEAAETEVAMPGADDAQAAPEVTEAAPPTEAAPAESAPETTEAAPAEAPVDAAAPQENTEIVNGESELVAAPQATEAPTAVPQQVQPRAVPIAYVELNPGANLQCRELPGADKRSLGLIPSGTTLTVLGRTGTPLVPETGDVTPEPTPVVESVEELWLSVQWDTPGGGYLRCWVNAQFLRVEFQGRLLDDLEELWELPEQPFNEPGENVGADVAPPTPRFDAIIATVDLQPGVSLQLRRYPQTDAESLNLVPALAQLEVLGYAEAPGQGLVGQPSDPNWLYVRYRMEDGGATVGWVSAQYVSLSRQGRAVTLEEVPLVDVSEAGYFEAPGQLAIQAEAQKIIGLVDLNPGANLNLRDRPSADARVVLGIPSGETLELDGRNGDGTWVHGLYLSAAGQFEGWVAAQYLIITQNNQPFDVSTLPILTGEADATPAPDATEATTG